MFHSLRFFSRIFLIFSLLSFHAFMHADIHNEEPLIVKISTNSSLTPVYLLPFELENPEFPSQYIEKLEKVLLFDLSYNGDSSVVPKESFLNKIAQSTVFEHFGSMKEWKDHSVFYVIKIKIQGKELNSLILDVNQKSIKSPNIMTLTGDLNQDRKQIHLLADSFYQVMFKKPGIATSRILFTLQTKPSSDSSSWISEIWESDYDGANLKQITHEGSTCLTPVYIPPKPGYSSGGFLYVSYQSGQPKIYISSLKNPSAQRLSYLKGNQFMPAISQQRDQVAFISDVTGNPDLFLQPFSVEKGAIDKPQQIFSAFQATQGSPTFSPDGKQLAFVSNKDGSPKIYVMTIPKPGSSLNTIKPTLISKINRENSAPKWSPDGQMIAYCARTKQKERQIWIYDFKTNQERAITTDGINKENPTWGPNNRTLIYNTADRNSNELFLTTIDQPTAVQITSGAGEKSFASWEPR